MYNLTLLQNATGLSGMAMYANSVTSGAFASMILISIFFIMLMALKRYDFRHTIMASSFMCFILSILLLYAKLINPVFPFIFIILLAGSFLWLILDKG